MKKTKFWIVFAVFALLQVLTGAALAAPSAQKITSETGIASGTAVIGEASGGVLSLPILVVPGKPWHRCPKDVCLMPSSPMETMFM